MVQVNETKECTKKRGRQSKLDNAKFCAQLSGRTCMVTIFCSTNTLIWMLAYTRLGCRTKGHTDKKSSVGQKGTGQKVTETRIKDHKDKKAIVKILSLSVCLSVCLS